MKRDTFDLMRVWAALTGLALAGLFFARLYFGEATSEIVPMLIAAIGGFELVLFMQDIMRRRRGHG